MPALPKALHTTRRRRAHPLAARVLFPPTAARCAERGAWSPAGSGGLFMIAEMGMESGGTPLKRLQSLALRGPDARVAAVIIGQKCALLFLLLLSAPLFPSHFAGATGDMRFRTWDTGPYLEIARDGYRNPNTRAFYPLWPTCIRAGSWLTGGHTLIAGYLLANLLSLAGLLIFHRLVWESHGLRAAYCATLLLLLFPGALFLVVPYSESLFLFLLMASVWLARRKALLTAAVVGALLPLTRATGIFAAPLLAWLAFQHQRRLLACLVCLGPLVGYAAYFAAMWRWAGSPWAGFAAQQMYPGQPSLSKIADVSGFMHCLLGFGWQHDFFHSFLDRAAFIVFLAALFPISRLGAGYYCYAFLAGLVPAMSNSMMSFSRFAVLVFPMFIVLGVAAKRSRLLPFVLMLSFGLQVLLLLRYTSGAWAG